MFGNNIKMSLDSLPNYETQLSGSEALVNESTMGDDYSWDMARAMENIGDNMSDIFPCTPPEAQFLNDTYSDKESSVNETDDNPVDTFDAETDLDDEFAPTSAEIFSKLTNQTKRLGYSPPSSLFTRPCSVRLPSFQAFGYETEKCSLSRRSPSPQIC